jgi:AAA domain
MRVVILDFEDSQAGLRSDLISIAKSRGVLESPALDQNLQILCDTKRFCSLSNEENRNRLAAELKSLAPDLIIIDTITRGFAFEDENSNAKVREQVMNPLVRLAAETNAAILFAHHDGKYGLEKSHNSAVVHKFRGASTMGDVSRVILMLTKKNTDTIQLTAAKTKGAIIPPTTFRLDPVTRSLIDVTNLREKSSNKPLVSSRMEPNRSYSIAELTNSFFPDQTERTTQRDMDDEIEAGFIVKNKRGDYRLFPNNA